MQEKDYIIRVESFNPQRESAILQIVMDITRLGIMDVVELMNNLPFSIDVWESEVERVKNDLEIASATVHVEKKVKDTLKNRVGFRNYEQTTTYSASQNTAVSEETHALKNYLKDVYLLERQIYTYEQISNEYEKTYENLNEEKNTLWKYEKFRGEITNRSGNLRVVPPKEIRKNYNSIDNFYRWHWVPESWHDELFKIENSSSGGGKIFLVFLVFLFGGYIAGFFLCPAIAHWELSILERLVLAGIVGVIPAIVLFGILAYDGRFGSLNPKNYGGKTYEKFLALYEEKYNQEIKAKEHYVESKLKSVVNEYQENVIPNLNGTQALLNKVYSANIIHPKYRHFVAVSQIYEYFETGRCTELEGPHGAYNLYESELRLNTIIDKLDIIIQKLNAFNATMGMVVSAINYSNRMLSDISSSLNRIEANTALTAYNTQCIAFNTELSSRY